MLNLNLVSLLWARGSEPICVSRIVLCLHTTMTKLNEILGGGGKTINLKNLGKAMAPWLPWFCHLWALSGHSQAKRKMKMKNSEF